MLLKSDLVFVFIGVLFAVLLAGVLTDALKTAIGRPRPNFFWRCFPSGDEVRTLHQCVTLVSNANAQYCFKKIT